MCSFGVLTITNKTPFHIYILYIHITAFFKIIFFILRKLLIRSNVFLMKIKACSFHKKLISFTLCR